MKAAQTPFTVSSATSGAYLTLAFIPSWSEGITAGRGWISVALCRLPADPYCDRRLVVRLRLRAELRGPGAELGGALRDTVDVALYRNIGRHDDSQTILEKYARLGCGASGA